MMLAAGMGLAVAMQTGARPCVPFAGLEWLAAPRLKLRKPGTMAQIQHRNGDGNMMRIRYSGRSTRPLRACAAILVGMAGALLPMANAAAQSTPLVQPGAWLVTPDSAGGASVGYQLCFKTGSLDDVKLLLPNLTPPADCPPVSTTVAGGQLLWRIDCPARALKADARYALSAETIDGTFVLERGTSSVTSTQAIKARRTGACP